MIDRRFIRDIGLVAGFMMLLTLPLSAVAGTTGTLRGYVVESGSGAPLAGVKITASSPSQIAVVVSDSSGGFSFIALTPDTYTVRVEKTGYYPSSRPGISVFADQSATLNLQTVRILKTIRTVTARVASSLVQPGATSDVYLIAPAAREAAASLSGADSLNQAYGAIASAPGVQLPSNQQGWSQMFYVRGGDYTQNVYELDGVPITRQSDLAPVGTLSSLGNQEVQVYTGGTQATSSSSGLAGYVNQVIETGTYPGFAGSDLGIGGPALYHNGSFQIGGATPDRLFSYYAGFGLTNQTYRFGDQFGGAGDPLYFYPFAAPTSNSLYDIVDGSCTVGNRPTCSPPNYGFIAGPGDAYEQAQNLDDESVVNLHFRIPQKNSSLQDDVQLLYVQGAIADQIFSSQNDIGYTPANAAAIGVGYPLPYLNPYVYTGKLMQAPKAADITTEPFPNSPDNSLGSTIDANYRDSNFNGYSIEKLQYQKNFENAYLRLIAYGESSQWLIRGPNSAIIPFGATPPNFAYIDHTLGTSAMYSNQLSTKHLLTALGSYATQDVPSYNAQSSSTGSQPGSLEPTGLGTILASYGTPNGKCYNYKTGQAWSCFSAGSQGGCLLSSPCYANSGPSGINLTPGYAPAGSAAALAGATWMVTENGNAAEMNDTRPIFSSLALTDEWHPNDRLQVNAGIRLDQFVYVTSDLESDYPARQFWFDAYNNEHCGALGRAPQYTWTGSSFSPCAAGFLPFTDPGVGLSDSAGNTFAHAIFQPRLSLTYAVNSDTVIRGSLGKYAGTAGSNYYQYNTEQENLPAFLGQFYEDGYHTPDHDVLPDTSNNFDLSFEQHVVGTRFSYKVTPFYRSTENQLQFQNINPEEGIYAQVNAGQQQSYGVELQLQYGDFGKNGFSALLSYAHTDSQIRFVPVNGVSIISSFNNQIELYNSYTAACAGVTKSSPNWQACGSGAYAGNAAPNLPYQRSSASYPKTILNPYYQGSLQPLLNPSGEYAPYDLIPGPFSGANGYEVPDVATLILNYRHHGFAITPSLRYIDGSNYGAPLVYPGYVPQSCTAPPANTPQTPGATCNGTLPNGQSIGAIFLPDPYTGKFDTLGAFMQPSELSLNLQLSYDLSPRVTVTFQAVNLVNVCHQRGYAWDNSETCAYSDLPSQVLAPSGNFVTDPPVQLKYPYGTYFNCNGAGFSAVVQPFDFFVTMTLKRL